MRLPAGGRIDRTRPISFTWDGRELSGFAGDTLASALLASGVRVVARSAVLARPRGIFTAGAEEPNAFVQLRAPWDEPLVAATRIDLVPGLAAESLAGRGHLLDAPETARYEKRYAHCDVLVVGGGPAGVAAALAAGRSGARVILVEQEPELGGWQLGGRGDADGSAEALAWVARAAAELATLPEVTVLLRTTAVGAYDGNSFELEQAVGDRLGSAAPPGLARRRLWRVRARQAVLATGAAERPLVFAGNDRPGVLLAGAARAYVNRWAVAPGRRAVVFATTDAGLACADDLAAAGIEVAAVIDGRTGRVVERTRAAERGEPGVLAGVTVREADGGTTELDCDLLCVSGGYDPVLGLHQQRRGATRWDETLGCFLPAAPVPGQRVAGAAAGRFRLGGCIADGACAGDEAAIAAGFAGTHSTDVLAEAQAAVDAVTPGEAVGGAPLWLVPPAPGTGLDEHFVDLHRDATAAGIGRAIGAGVTAIEHVKRYTLVGTGADQGRLAGVATAAIAAQLLGRGIEEVGTQSTRPPAKPLLFALLAGRATGPRFEPTRTTPIHPWHVAAGAVFEPVGQWLRPRHFPRTGEGMDAAVLRECRAAREGVAVMDASTLGKIDIQGPDAAELLNRVYTNAFDTLAPGRCRYGVLCKADGMIFDDGVVMRLAADRFLATTTTSGAAAVLDHLEEFLQTEWPELRVRLTSVTEQWATVAVVGPRSRDVLAALAPGLEASREAFPFMAIRETEIGGVAARVCRVSFSGELAYEINVAGAFGLALWETVMAAGEQFGITPYGTEAMHVLRAEKGFIIVGQDTDGTVTPQDAGLDWIVSKTKPFFVGRRSFTRADTARPDRKQLVGLLPVDPQALLPEGAQLVVDPAAQPPVEMHGHVTSSYRSAELGRTFALALLRSGRERHGETVYAPLPGGTIEALVVSPVFVDPDGTRRDG